jgi:uncharacterized membrane protein
MAKQAHQKKLSSNKDGVLLEQNSVYDDSLLPPADELAKLNDINPDIIKWIMDRTSLEQETRHLHNRERLEMTKYEFRGTRRYNIAALIFAFFVIIAGLSFSTFLIYNEMNIVGTIFAGGTLIMAANAFINASKKTSQ